VEAHKIDYGTAKSHWMNLRFKNGQPSVAGGDIKKGTSSYNEVVHLQQTLKEKDFVLLLAELADRSPTHYHMAARYWEKRGWEVKIAGEVLADAKQFYTNEPPVSVIIQETKELSPAPIPIVVKKTKKDIKKINKNFINALDDIILDISVTQFKNLSMFQQDGIIGKLDDELDAIVIDLDNLFYEKQLYGDDYADEGRTDALMTRFNAIKKDVKAKRKIYYNSAEYIKHHGPANFNEPAMYDL
jgi:hypothetical protein